jgi:hypothetical protein
LEPHPNHSRLESSGIKSIFKFKNLARNKWAHPKIFLLNLHILWDASNTYFFIFSFWITCVLISFIWNVVLKCWWLQSSMIERSQIEMKNIYRSKVDSLFTLATKPTKASSIMVVCFALDSQDPQHLLAFLSY